MANTPTLRPAAAAEAPAAHACVRSPRITPALLERLRQHATVAQGRRDSIPVHLPFTGERLAEIPHGTEADVELAFFRARAAQPGWARLPFADRARIYLRFHDLLLDRHDEVLDLMQLENGKARHDAYEEVFDTATVARYYAFHGEQYLKPRRRRGAVPGLTVAVEFQQPVGVVGMISPWNYPLNLPLTDSAAAILAGNAVVLRPDPQTSFTVLWAVDLLREAGLPADVLQVVTGPGAELGPHIIGRSDFVMFTGSTRTGKVIARQAAERLIGCSLELGGKNPMLVLQDADVERAADGAVRGCFVGAGQVCVSIERIYVHESKFDAFAERFIARTAELRLGSGLDYSADMGTLTSQRQLETVSDHVQDALARGATLLHGGRARPDLGPYFYEPTILTNVREGMKLFAEETFGPVVSLYRFRTDAEAIELANRTRYGLNASVWSGSERHGMRVARQIRAGTVNVNESYAATWASVDAPIGGMKESGLHRRHGAEGIRKYTETQTVALQRLRPLAMPNGGAKEIFSQLMTGALRVLRHTPGVR